MDADPRGPWRTHSADHAGERKRGGLQPGQGADRGQAPKTMGWVAVIGMLFFTGVILVMILQPNGTERPWVFAGFYLFDLMGAWLLWMTLIWRVEVFRSEDFFVLRDYLGRKHKIRYEDCRGYQFRYHRQEIIVHNRVKHFTVSCLLVNYGTLLAALQQHHV